MSHPSDCHILVVGCIWETLV